MSTEQIVDEKVKGRVEKSLNVKTKAKFHMTEARIAAIEKQKTDRRTKAEQKKAERDALLELQQEELAVEKELLALDIDRRKFQVAQLKAYALKQRELLNQGKVSEEQEPTFSASESEPDEEPEVEDEPPSPEPIPVKKPRKPRTTKPKPQEIVNKRVEQIKRADNLEYNQTIKPKPRALRTASPLRTERYAMSEIRDDDVNIFE